MVVYWPQLAVLDSRPTFVDNCVWPAAGVPSARHFCRDCVRQEGVLPKLPEQFRVVQHTVWVAVPGQGSGSLGLGASAGTTVACLSACALVCLSFLVLLAGVN